MNDVPNFVREANAFSFVRVRGLPKKITPMLVRQHIEISMVLGEVGGAERVLSAIQDLRKQHPDFTIADVEAAIHEFLSIGLNYISKNYNHIEAYPIERILNTHGYYNKESHETSKE